MLPESSHSIVDSQLPATDVVWNIGHRRLHSMLEASYTMTTGSVGVYGHQIQCGKRGVFASKIMTNFECYMYKVCVKQFHHNSGYVAPQA